MSVAVELSRRRIGAAGAAAGGVLGRDAASRTRLLRFGSIAAVLAVLLAFAIAAPGFATAPNLANVVEQSAVLAILAFGLTLVVVGGGSDVVRGGIDLSLGANLGLCDAVFTVVSAARHAPSAEADAVAVLLTLGTGALVGLVNGIAVVGFGILPLLATLTVMNVCAGLELVLTGNTTLTTPSPLLALIGGGRFAGLSFTDWILLAVAVLAALGFHASPIGLRLRAVGGHREAARAAGLPVRRTIVGSYVVAGLLAALAAIVQAARLSGSSPGSGDILLSVVLTSLMSAVFSRRLEPSIGGTLVSVLFIGCLINGFQLLDVSSDWVNAVEGLLILSVVTLALAVGFSAASPTFRTAANLGHVLVNNFALPALVSLGMTLAVAVGGIDLSVGIAADFAAMISVTLLGAGHGLALASVGGLGGALAVGVADAVLITRLRISPFLATLGILFIGQSVQQLATNGGTPIYLVSGFPAHSLDALAHGTVAAVPVPLLIVAAAAFVVEVLLARSVYGRHVRLIGAGQSVARYSGLPIGRTVAATFVLSALLAGSAGILLAATVRSYVPMSGNGFLLDAIGAVFVGTTVDRDGRANVGGTLLGVFLFGMLHNGLLLIGWNFTWQQVAIGLLVLAVLAASFGARGRRRAA